jgi:protein TonB
VLDLQPWQGRQRWKGALLASFACHCVVLLALIYRPAAKVLVLSQVALGTPGSYGSVTYLAPMGPEVAKAPQMIQVPHRPVVKEASISKPVDRLREAPVATAANAPGESARDGSAWGDRIPGTPIAGPEVVPALPEVFPDPPVARSEIPSGVEGDVIVEVTIDQEGNVVEEKLLQGMGYGIEDKVLAGLRLWHFRPATKNGVAIASQHIVHFHYPG